MIEPRFYDPALSPSLRELRLDGDEGRHLTRVLRLGAGDRVRVFDGRGLEVRAEIVTVEKAAALVRILELAPTAPEPRVEVTVLQAVLKGDGMDAVVRDATMMGVAVIQPVLTARTVVTTKALGPQGASAIARWRRVAIASAKQCGRARIPEIEPPRALSAVLHDRAERAPVRLMLVEPSAAPSQALDVLPSSQAVESNGSPRVSLLVGPEGGWTPAEVEEATAVGWTPWSLGPLTLRADAAALVAVAALGYAIQRQRSSDAARQGSTGEVG
jgi:16S rRNA (uracil1498-N3)-methyltransferase